MKLTKLYTRTGDNGTTSLIGGIRVSKTNGRIDAYGTIDELSSHLGMLVAMMHREPTSDAKATAALAEEITRIQQTLFELGSFLAIDQQQTPLYEGCRVAKEKVEWLEGRIDTLQQQRGNLPGFIIPGGTESAAQAHICRTVCRRAERLMIAIVPPTGAEGKAPEEGWQEALAFINRLSDYLFVLARQLNALGGVSDVVYSMK